jgi:hypothetical protein
LKKEENSKENELLNILKLMSSYLDKNKKKLTAKIKEFISTPINPDSEDNEIINYKEWLMPKLKAM